MAEVIIRAGRHGDEPGIHESHMRSINEVCIRDHGEEEVRQWGNRPLGDRWKAAIEEGYVWVAEQDGRIRGSCYIRINVSEPMAYIHSLYLSPEILHQGIGKKLVDLMIDKAKELKVLAITLESTITAHDFYKRLGFEDAGPMKCVDFGETKVRCFPMILNLNNERV
jgi:GNAT superfamily N-acetyltransferase